MVKILVSFSLGLLVGIFGFKVCVQTTLNAGATVLKTSGKVIDSSNQFISKVAK